jgi:uncharacterized protein
MVMDMSVQRPILVGGLALSLGLWGLDSVGHVFNHVSTLGLMAAAGAGWWWYQRTRQSPVETLSSSSISLSTIKKSLADVALITQKIQQEDVDEPGEPSRAALNGQSIQDWMAHTTSRVEAITASLSDRTLRAVLLGSAGVGKSTLLKVLNADSALTFAPWQLTLQESPSLFEHTSIDDFDSISASDLVLYVIAGDLTESDYQVLQTLQARQQAFIVVLNKQDHYLPADQDALLQHIQHRLQSLTEVENLVAIAANPNPIKIRHHEQTGEIQEWLETPQPVLVPLIQRLSTRIAQDGEPMRWATAFRQAEQLKHEAKAQLDQRRRDRAQPIVEQYQWIAAGATFVNPLPALDLLATTAVNTQMVLELGEVYQQKLSLEHAQTIAGEIAKLLVKLGVAELASQAIASTLKTNFITYVAGGTLQGMSAAYLTRLAGLSLMDYFQAQDVREAEDGFSLRSLQERLQTAFQVHQQALNLPQFVSQGLQRLRPEPELASQI